MICEFSSNVPRYIAWSPCGTRIAFSAVRGPNITIFDQRRGLLPNHGNNNNNNNNNTGWVAHAHGVTALKFSTDGSFLVSAGLDGFIRLCENVTGNFAQLQAWDMHDENNGDHHIPTGCFIDIDISLCCKYIVASKKDLVCLKDVENGGTTVKSLTPPFDPLGCRVNFGFSSEGHTIFVSYLEGVGEGVVMKVWRPQLDDNENSLLDMGRYEDPQGLDLIFSQNNKMVASCEDYGKGELRSIDMNRNCLTNKFYVPGSDGKRLLFTADDEHIVYNTESGPKFWSIAKNRFSNNSIYNNDKGLPNIEIMSFSPNNQQLVIRKQNLPNNSVHYITSYILK